MVAAPAPAQSVGGTGGNQQAAAVTVGSAFGVPKYGTSRRFVPDNGNGAVGFTPVQGAQVNCPTTKLDQLDIVRGMKLGFTIADIWTAGSGKTLYQSPFYPGNLIQSINFKLQAAYNQYNQTGALAQIIQAFRPMWGNKQINDTNPDAFANPVHATAPTIDTSGGTTNIKLVVDIPFGWWFDEYFDLSPEGDPVARHEEALVSPVYMAAQARVVTPTVTMAPGLTSSDLLGGGVSTVGAADSTSTFSGSGTLNVYRDAYWTGSNPAANPPVYPWMYTRDYFTQGTQGQNKVGVLLLNTGVSLGQVLSIYGFVWDPAANTARGAIVPMTSISSFELVTGGSLQNRLMSPQMLTDEMRARYGAGVVSNLPNGVFVFDFAQQIDGAYMSNKDAINTYLLNGVALNISFVSGSAPGSTATVYLGVEALKLATS